MKSQASITESWTAVNPSKGATISAPKAFQFLKKLLQDHCQSRIYPLEPATLSRISSRLENYLKAYKQASHAQTLPQGDVKNYSKEQCLQIWKKFREDPNELGSKEWGQQEQIGMNEFEEDKTLPVVDLSHQVKDQNYKKGFVELTPEEQQEVLKKSQEMVQAFAPQLKLLFNHYCRFHMPNETKKAETFSEAPNSLNQLTLNRFMHFCKDFSIIKSLQFKRKGEHGSKISKGILLQIFKKGAYLQKHMDLDRFMMSIIALAVRLHDNYDPRSYMHIELMLSLLHVNNSKLFMQKLNELGIKYSVSQFTECFHHLLTKIEPGEQEKRINKSVKVSQKPKEGNSLRKQNTVSVKKTKLSIIPQKVRKIHQSQSPAYHQSKKKPDIQDKQHKESKLAEGKDEVKPSSLSIKAVPIHSEKDQAIQVQDNAIKSVAPLEPAQVSNHSSTQKQQLLDEPPIEEKPSIEEKPVLCEQPKVEQKVERPERATVKSYHSVPNLLSNRKPSYDLQVGTVKERRTSQTLLPSVPVTHKDPSRQVEHTFNDKTQQIAKKTARKFHQQNPQGLVTRQSFRNFLTSKISQFSKKSDKKLSVPKVPNKKKEGLTGKPIKEPPKLPLLKQIEEEEDELLQRHFAAERKQQKQLRSRLLQMVRRCRENEAQ